MWKPDLQENETEFPTAYDVPETVPFAIEVLSGEHCEPVKSS